MQMNPCYIPQLQEVLTWPQSAGIVGGRPSSSLYFIGVQDQNVLYLDPHEVQQVHIRRACLWCDGSAIRVPVLGSTATW